MQTRPLHVLLIRSILNRYLPVCLSIHLSICPSCVQVTVRNFGDILMKFGAQAWFDIKTNAKENGLDRTTISTTFHIKLDFEIFVLNEEVRWALIHYNISTCFQVRYLRLALSLEEYLFFALDFFYNFRDIRSFYKVRAEQQLPSGSYFIFTL